MSAETWLIIGVVSIMMEVMILPGIGFLFVGLAAILLGGILLLDFLLQPSLAEQIAYFLFFTAVWWIVLWRPLKRSIRKRAGGETYENLIGTTGVVDDERDLTQGKVGHIKWSGAKMRARIVPASETKRITNGSTVTIHGQKDGILLVDIE